MLSFVEHAMVLADNLVSISQSIPHDAKHTLQWLATCLMVRSSTIVSSEHSASLPPNLLQFILGFHPDFASDARSWEVEWLRSWLWLRFDVSPLQLLFDA